jgi:hypothetical protein
MGKIEGIIYHYVFTMTALLAKRNEGRYEFHEGENAVKAKDKWLILSHTIKKLDTEHLTQRKDKRDELFTNPAFFKRYQQRLGIPNLQQATPEEKIKILRYFIVLNTKLPALQETILHLVYTVLTKKPLDTNKLKPRKEATFFSQATCGSSSVLFLQLARAFLGLSGEIRSIAGHHSYIVLNADKKQYFIDFSEKLILLGYKPYSS